jgi:curved DNA-binding protein CbpA
MTREQVDYYALLQVAPNATSEQINVAYERQRDLYSQERFADSEPEVQALWVEKVKQLEAAFVVLRDPELRVVYDRKRVGASAQAIDFKPLAPARGQERSEREESEERPRAPRSSAKQGWQAWIAPAAVALGALALLLVVVLSGVRTTDGREALATPTIRGVVLPYADEEIRQLTAVAQTENTAAAWVTLGNALFDNLQTMREQAPQSPQYRGQIARWLDVAQAYERSLELQDNQTVRSDRAIALFNYGQDAGDQQRLAEALAQVEQSIAQDVTEPRALINYGLILAQVQPPRREQAFAQWRKLLEIAPDSPEARAAERLLQSYGQL